MQREYQVQNVEVVLNRCYGGFGLARLAMDRLLELGFELTEGEKVYYPKVRAETGYFSYDPVNLLRHDPRLVQVVRELGQASWGDSAKLEIKTVYCRYWINDFDGRETLIDGV